jgi:hypothetical protein
MEGDDERGGAVAPECQSFARGDREILRCAALRIRRARAKSCTFRDRAELRHDRPYPLDGEPMFAILGVPSGRNRFSSAEVAERQTR